METAENTQQNYKQTSVGLIPNDWGVKKLGEIILESKLGGNYENSENNEGIPVIKMGNIGRGNMNIFKIQNLPINEKYNEDDVLKKGDLLFNTRNTLDLVGKVAIWNNELPFVLYNSNLLRLSFKSEFVASNWFMNFSLNSARSLVQLRGFATGTTSVAAIYGRDLNHLKIPLPPLPEQQKIAKILSTWDEAIDKCKRIIDELKVRNKGFSQKLLTGKMRVKGFGEDLKNEYFVAGNYINEVSLKNRNTQIKRVLSVTNSRGFINQTEQFDREVASADLSNYKIVKKNQFAYNPSRVNVGSLDLLKTFEEGILSPMYVVFETDNTKLLPDFFHHHLKTHWFRGHVPMFVQGSVRDSLSYDGLCGIKFFIPPLEEQKTITTILDKATEELNQYQQKLENLQLQKKGLMQQLLTGKVRTV